MNQPVASFRRDRLQVHILQNTRDMGVRTATAAAAAIQEAVEARGVARVIFATGVSQFGFLGALMEQGIAWDKVHAFHLDEYVGIAEDHPASFRRYLQERLFDAVRPGKVHLLNANAEDLDQECARYSALLLEEDIDLACIGIGENGHIAFNDPAVADFDDPAMVKVVALDEACRRQQLGEGWFPSLDAVPSHALTQTIPAIMRSRTINCICPEARKAKAVRDALQGPIARSCPAAVLRRHPNCTLWLDEPAASLLSL